MHVHTCKYVYSEYTWTHSYSHTRDHATPSCLLIMLEYIDFTLRWSFCNSAFESSDRGMVQRGCGMAIKCRFFSGSWTSMAKALHWILFLMPGPSLGCQRRAAAVWWKCSLMLDKTVEELLLCCLLAFCRFGCFLFSLFCRLSCFLFSCFFFVCWYLMFVAVFVHAFVFDCCVLVWFDLLLIGCSRSCSIACFIS